MSGQGALKLGGDVRLEVIPAPPNWGSPGIQEPTLRECIRLGFPRVGLPDEVNVWRTKNLPHLYRGLRDVRAAQKSRAPTFLGFLHLAKILRDGTRVELGLANARVVTTAWVNFLVDSMQDAESNLIDLFIYHGIGTGSTAEAAGDTDIETELTTQYQTNNTRATGTATEGASANIYRSVGTNQVDAAVAITEHGLLNNATVGSGTLLDRTVFSVVNLASGESLQSTYELTVSAGG